MNAAGLTVAPGAVSAALGMPHVQSLVTSDSIDQGELDGTRRLC